MTLEFTDTIQSNHEQAIEHATDGLQTGLWIDGENRDAADEETFEPRDPAVAEPITPVARGKSADIDAAVDAAERASEDAWADTTSAERSQALLEWIGVLRDAVDELALLECLEVGKPLAAARADVENGLEFFEYYAAVVRAQEGQQIPTGPDSHAYVRDEPYGVAGLILPWNYPILLMAWKVGAALAAGNTAVVKPAEQAPLAIIRAAQLSKDVLPDGVLNVVPGYGEEAGAPLTEHRDIDVLSFTGSVPVGQTVMHAAADTVTPVTLELGGKNPFVVFPDADIEAAAATAAVGGLYNAGQSCDAASRLIVHEDVKATFLEELLAELESYAPGDPLTDETVMGPLCHQAGLETVDDYVDVGRREGATLVTGGGRATDGELADGWFYEPTVFDDVDSDMRIAQEEIFGPVLAVMSFGSYDEAIEIANGVQYGLTAGVATGNPSTAHRAAADLEAGSVWVNQYFGTVPGTPFGGFKQSGIGRECARETLGEYTQSKAVSMALGDPDQ